MRFIEGMWIPWIVCIAIVALTVWAIRADAADVQDQRAVCESIGGKLVFKECVLPCGERRP